MSIFTFLTDTVSNVFSSVVGAFKSFFGFENKVKNNKSKEDLDTLYKKGEIDLEKYNQSKEMEIQKYESEFALAADLVSISNVDLDKLDREILNLQKDDSYPIYSLKTNSIVLPMVIYPLEKTVINQTERNKSFHITHFIFKREMTESFRYAFREVDGSIKYSATNLNVYCKVFNRAA